MAGNPPTGVDSRAFRPDNLGTQICRNLHDRYRWSLETVLAFSKELSPMRAITLFFCLWFPCCLAAQEVAPTDPLELSEAVLKLEEKLGSQSIPERDAAEHKLTEWGLPVLDHLSPVSDSQSSDLQQRLQRIRVELERLAVIAVSNPSKVQLGGKLTLAQALSAIQKQTGNVIEANVPAELLQREHVWQDQPVEFWNALSQILSAYPLRVDPYGGQPQSLSLVEQGPIAPGAGNVPPSAVANVLWCELTRIDATRNFLNPELSRMTFGLVIRWEPRLRPISIDIPQASLKIVDEYDKTWELANSETVFYGMVQPEIPELEFNLEQPLLDRQIEEIKSLSGVCSAVLPGRIENFEFRGIGTVPPDTRQTKGGATVTYDGLLKMDDLYGARLALSFSEENNALESHQSWAYQNECFLQTADGRRIDSIGTETYQQENARLGVMYFFPEYPADAKLVYRTPAAIVKVQIPFQLKGIKLP
ncbi:MAG: hypothetical protein ACK6CE_20140 [Planctomycetota bacterium]